MTRKVCNCLNIVFMGTPAFSIPTLTTLIESPHNLKCVYTQPAKPSGRGLKEQFSHIHKVANDRGINIRTPKIISDDSEFIFLQACTGIFALPSSMNLRPLAYFWLLSFFSIFSFPNCVTSPVWEPSFGF